MSVGVYDHRNTKSLEIELYILIEKFLSAGPCKNAGVVLRRELDEHGLLPKRLDWEGNEHDRSFESLLELNRHIGSNHLLKICQRLGPLLDEKIRPSVMGVGSLLGTGHLSLLRTEEDMKRLEWHPHTHMALHHGKPMPPPVNLVQPKLMFLKRGIETCGQAHFNHSVPTTLYSQLELHSRKLGHLSAVYCVLFDRTGRFIFTGADDHLVKIWQAYDGRLRATLRGHSSEITDMAINHENTMLASGSCDKTVRVWCLKTKAPIAVLSGHTAIVTSIEFSPLVYGHDRFLASTGTDGSVCFWKWDATTNTFNPKPLKYVEKSYGGAQVLCSSFSPGGAFFAAGSTDHVIRVYHFVSGTPEKIGELEAHKERVDSLCYSNRENRFLSGSRDGTARIWKFERSQWRNLPLKIDQQLKRRRGDGDADTIAPADLVPEDSERTQPKLKVTMVVWNSDDSLVATAISNYTLKVWCSYTGTLNHILQSHEDEVYVLEANPIDPRIMVSAGHDGNIIIWDIIQGHKVKAFFNMIEGQGHGAVFDCKFSADGTTFAATDSHGHLMVHGFGSNEKHKKIPKAVFFHTDYRPLMRDANGYVLDEQTQQAPHLMPPPFLVDIDGNPYPPPIQRLVPGREGLKDEQLVPQLAVNEEGEQEVLGDQEPEEVEDDPPESSGEVAVAHRPSLDHMIEQLQREQDQRLVEDGHEPLSSPPPPSIGSPSGVSRSNSVVATPSSSSHMVGMRRIGETEGVRQSLGNIQQVSTSTDLVALNRMIVVRELEPALLKKSEETRRALAELELQQYNTERRRRPTVVRHASDDESSEPGIKTRKKGRKSKKHGYSTRGADNEDAATNRLTTRALYDSSEEPEDEEMEDNEATQENEDSSEYSDWMGDQGGSNLEPPKRKSTRIRKRKRYTSSSDETEEEEVYHSSRESSLSRSPKKDNQPAKKRGKGREPIILFPDKSPEEIAEILARFEMPRWILETRPRRQPYFPQVGDEIIYLRQGHELYVDEVKRRDVYKIDIYKGQPWHKSSSLRYQELVRISGLRLEVNPIGVRLCCLKLNYMDPVTGKNSGGNFSIKYHDMPDVVDFLVLKQNYDIAISRDWKPGDRFRSIIDDSWWMGIIEEQVPFQKEYPDAMFHCLKVRWDNSERDRLSPWDLEPLDDTRDLKPKDGSMHGTIRDFVEDCIQLFNHSGQSGVSSELGGGIHITDDELVALQYTPKASEWPSCGREEESERLIHGWDLAMAHPGAESFLKPVDLNLFPSYAISIEYPMDLNLMKQRLENRYYRRIAQVQFDVRFLESNAAKFNEPESEIVRSAKVITEALLEFTKNTSLTDPGPEIDRLLDGRQYRANRRNADMTDSGSDTSHIDQDSQGKQKKAASVRRPKKKKRLSVTKLDPEGWKSEFRQLLDTILQCEDSTPFRQPVDITMYPRKGGPQTRRMSNYYTVIDNPMDLANIGENLRTGLYAEPTELARDMKLMFSNSKSYNTNKRSRIYAMTLRLSAMFEEKMKVIISTWRQAVKQQRLRIPKPLLYSASRVSTSTTAGTSGLFSRPFRATATQGLGLTNGYLLSPDDDSDNSDSPVQSPVVQRPKRAAALRKTTFYDDSDDEMAFPAPRPDYSDDDFKMLPKRSPVKREMSPKRRRLSPKKKGWKNQLVQMLTLIPPWKKWFISTAAAMKVYSEMLISCMNAALKHRIVTEVNKATKNVGKTKDVNKLLVDKFKRALLKSKRGGRRAQSKSNSRYTTRAATGTIKTRVYTNEGSITDNEDEEGVEVHNGGVEQGHSGTEDSGSDTDVDYQRSIQKSKKLARKTASSKPCKKAQVVLKRVTSNTDSESDSSSAKEPGSESDAKFTSDEAKRVRRLSGSSSDTIIEEPHSPVTRSRTTQGHGLDDEVKGAFHRQSSSSYASGATSSKKSARSTRFQGKRTVAYAEDSDNSENSDNAISVSSRGRVRRPTHKVRDLWD